MLNPNSNLGNSLVVCFLHFSKFLTTGFLFGLDNGDPLQTKALKARILIQVAVMGQAVVGFIRGLFIVLFAFTCQGQQNDLTQGSNQDNVFKGMVLFLPLKHNFCAS